ncbi:MAG: PIN domain-containing protein [Euryarchaeota archaeon]|nr:PIN domain-containing protein [Euryarchaeota archaeon]
MKIVVDANRFFSALLKDGPARKAIYETRAALFAPEFLKIELARHREELQRRSRLTPTDFSKLMDEVAAQIVWVPDEAIHAHLSDAARAIGTVDISDVPYLASALAIKADAIWSHDLDFDKQTLVPRVPHPDSRP